MVEAKGKKSRAGSSLVLDVSQGAGESSVFDSSNGRGWVLREVIWSQQRSFPRLPLPYRPVMKRATRFACLDAAGDNNAT